MDAWLATTLHRRLCFTKTVRTHVCSRYRIAFSGTMVLTISITYRSKQVVFIVPTWCVSGIAIKMQYSDNMMHHKFAIVDGDILISGSTNWTMSAFFGNFDNILITNQRSLVKPFVSEFQKLWEVFESPIPSETEGKLDQLVCDSASSIQ